MSPSATISIPYPNAHETRESRVAAAPPRARRRRVALAAPGPAPAVARGGHARARARACAADDQRLQPRDRSLGARRSLRLLRRGRGQGLAGMGGDSRALEAA